MTKNTQSGSLENLSTTVDFQTPITLHPSPIKSALEIVLCLVFIYLCLYVQTPGHWIDDVFVGFFALFGIVCLLNFLFRTRYLRLDAQGFTVRNLFWTRRIPWARVQGIVLYCREPFGPRRVGWNYTAEWRRKHNLCSRCLLALYGHSPRLDENYGMKPRALADLMNGYFGASIRQTPVIKESDPGIGK